MRDFISVNDVISAILLASASNEGGEFNVGTGIPVTIDELARKMIKIYGLILEPIYDAVDEGNNINERQEIRQSYANTRKSANILKFTAQDSIDSELLEMRKKSLNNNISIQIKIGFQMKIERRREVYKSHRIRLDFLYSSSK